MEKTDHVLLAGRGAERLARMFSLPEANPMTAYRRKVLISIMERGGVDERVGWLRKNSDLLRFHPEMLSHDTVGAVAVDRQGNFAASSSTGGTMMKLQGRIGDTPQIGCGLYADNRAGAATATGIGEVLIKLTISKAVCTMMERGATARAASIAAVKSASSRLKGGAGVIAIDKSGRIASVHNTPAMPWAVADTRTSKPTARAHGLVAASLRKLS
jgi:beta-aspartyl-peptidase (threonine type)